MSLPADVRDFLGDYPRLDDGDDDGDDDMDDEDDRPNFDFFSNTLKCQPDNLLIDQIHERWNGDYLTLERNHGYIQWLFPIQEHGMNFESIPLSRKERDAMKASPAIIERVIQSYRIMLDFYGLVLIDLDTGLLARSERYQERYRHLGRSYHNYLRISRILKHLSEMGLERLNAGFLLHFLNEQSEHEQLASSGLLGSMDRWWANCLRNEDERAWIGALIKNVRKHDFVLTRALYEQALATRLWTGKLSLDADAPAVASDINE